MSKDVFPLFCQKSPNPFFFAPRPFSCLNPWTEGDGSFGPVFVHLFRLSYAPLPVPQKAQIPAGIPGSRKPNAYKNRPGRNLFPADPQRTVDPVYFPAVASSAWSNMVRYPSIYAPTIGSVTIFPSRFTKNDVGMLSSPSALPVSGDI